MTDSADRIKRQAFEIYQAALELDLGDRGQFVSQETGGDQQLLAAVEALLASADEAEEQGFLVEPVAANLTNPTPTDSPMLGRDIGAYRLVDVLGEGGFGTVYLAEQSEPVQRRVALKLIRRDLCNSRLIARFEAERQTLALLAHPNIAQILDAGTGPEGEPYLVMEYLSGVSITQFCAAHELSVPARLELFIQVCEALQHAHQKSVIHRDIKPANVLVTRHEGRTVPKVIDFGIAKVLDLKVNEQTLATGTGFIGSPSYMSPEQIEQSDQDIDTRSDVYGLGVLLYELLTGTPPFVAKGDSVVTLLNKILETDPIRPSRQLEIGNSNDAESAGRASLGGGLEGDLDWIILKALARDRDQRYDSAAAFAADLRRYLNHEPVLARAPTLAYRAAKFVRRHTVGVVAAAIILLTLIGGVIGTGIGFVNARQEAANARAAEVIALEQTRSAEQTVALLLEFLTSADPREQGRELKVVELLEAFQPRLEALGDRPLIQASLLHAYAKTYGGLGLFEQALQFADEAVKLREAHLGLAAPATLASLNLQVEALREQGQYQAAETLGRETMQRARSALGPDHALSLDAATGTAAALEKLGFYEEAEALHRSTLARREAIQGPDHQQSLESMRQLAAVLRHRNKVTEAEQLNRQVLDRRRHVLGENHPETLSAMNELAIVIAEAGRLPDGEALHRETLERRRAVLGPDHPKTLTSLANLAWVVGAQGRYDESEQLTREAWEIEARTLGENHPTTLVTQNNLALAVTRLGHLADAEAIYRDALARQQAAAGSEHPMTLIMLNDLAIVLARQGQNEQARLLLEDLVARRRNVLGPDHPGTLNTLSNLGSVYRRLGQFAAAEAIYRSTLETQLRVMEIDHSSVAITTRHLTTVLLAQNKLADADLFVTEALAARRAALGEEHAETYGLLALLARVRHRQGQIDESRAQFAQALAGQVATLGADHPAVAQTRSWQDELP